MCYSEYFKMWAVDEILISSDAWVDSFFSNETRRQQPQKHTHTHPTDELEGSFAREDDGAI